MINIEQIKAKGAAEGLRKQLVSQIKLISNTYTCLANLVEDPRYDVVSHYESSLMPIPEMVIEMDALYDAYRAAIKEVKNG